MLGTSARLPLLLRSLRRFGLLVVLAAATTQAQAVAPEAPHVSTDAGVLQGMNVGSAGDVVVYRGIPFAQAPVGALRWRPPQAPRAWHGVRDASQFSVGCMQSVAGSRLPWTEEFMHHGPVGEDCLYLNVWAPAHARRAQLPVLVFIYGGGFSEGSTAVPLYDGAALARKHAVIVTLNYRVGALGFLAHPALTAESPHHASGNYGLMDQVAALRWVRKNIAAFGGDPLRVTLFGQSAGAMSVYLLTASAQAKGLFERAIVQSGPGALAAFGVATAGAMTQSEAQAEKAGLAFAQRLGAASLEALRAVDAERLTAPGGEPSVRFGPVVDGWFLTADVDTVYEQHRAIDVPLVIGMMADEGSFFPGYDAARAKQLRELGSQGLDKLLAARAAVSRAPAYAYYFAHAIPWPEHPEFGAFHSGELPYVFDNLALLPRPWSAADRALADTVSSYWISFAASGDPNGNGRPQWTAYVPGSQRVMVFGEQIKTGSLPQ
jgi:para-nitrobenzyl esterase